MDADDGEAVVAVLLVPCLQVGQRADAVDAGVGPEVDEHHPALALRQPGDGERLAVGGVEPLLRGAEVGRRAVVRELLARRRLGLAPLRGALSAADRREVVGDRVGSSSPPLGLTRNDGRSLGDRVLELEVEVGDHRDRDERP